MMQSKFSSRGDRIGPTSKDVQRAHQHDAHGVGMCFGDGTCTAEEVDCFGLLVRCVS
jgi:hypothetical protein